LRVEDNIFSGGISIGIFVVNHPYSALHTTIQSIELAAKEFKDWEIFICGKENETLPHYQSIIGNHLGDLRNRFAKAAQYKNLLLLDDDISLDPSFFTKLNSDLTLIERSEVLIPRLLNPDGSRYWDFATFGGPNGHVLLPYEGKDPFVYISPHLYLIKRTIALKVQWDSKMSGTLLDTVDYSRLLVRYGCTISSLPECVATHRERLISQVFDTPECIIDDQAFYQIGDCIDVKGIAELPYLTTSPIKLKKCSTLRFASHLLGTRFLLKIRVQALKLSDYLDNPLTLIVTHGEGDLGKRILHCNFTVDYEEKVILLPLEKQEDDLLLTLNLSSQFIPQLEKDGSQRLRYALFLKDIELEETPNLVTTLPIIEREEKSSPVTPLSGLQFVFSYRQTGITLFDPSLLRSFFEKLGKNFAVSPYTFDGSPIIKILPFTDLSETFWRRLLNNSLDQGVLLIVTENTVGEDVSRSIRLRSLYPNFTYTVNWFKGSANVTADLSSLNYTFDEVWGNTQSMCDYLLSCGISKAKVRLVPVGVDVDYFSPKEASLPNLSIRSGCTFLVEVGGSTKWEPLLYAFFSVFSKRDEVTLIIVADGGVDGATPNDGCAIVEQITNFIKTAGFDHPSSPQLLCLEKISLTFDFRSLLLLADAYIALSATRNGDIDPLAIAQAMAMEVPVVTANSLSSIEFVNEECGYLVTTNDENEVSWQHLGQTLREIYDYRREALHRGRISRRVIKERYTITHQSEWILKTLEAHLKIGQERDTSKNLPLASKIERISSSPVLFPTLGLTIGIDGRVLSYPKFRNSAAGRFALSFIEEVIKKAPSWRFLLFVNHDEEKLKYLSNLKRLPNFAITHFDYRFNYEIALFHTLDLFYEDIGLDSPLRTQAVAKLKTATVFDLNPLRSNVFDSWSSEKQYNYQRKIELLKESDLILLTPTNLGIYDLTQLASIPFLRIFSFGLGSFDQGTISNDSQDYQYFVYLAYLESSGLSSAVHIPQILEAFTEIRGRVKAHLVVVFDKTSELTEFYQELCERNGYHDLHVKCDLVAETLNALIKGSLGVIFYESCGVDLNLVAVMSLNVPVIAPSSPYSEEVIGGGGIILNVITPSSLAQSMINLCDHTFRARLVESSKLHTSNWKMTEVADRSVGVWRNLLGSSAMTYLSSSYLTPS
jgi:glycosyltransferase involved in cell wall biosynthesis